MCVCVCRIVHLKSVFVLCNLKTFILLCCKNSLTQKKNLTKERAYTYTHIMPLPSRLQVRHEGLSIVILGASGDLASKKLFPSLFNLHSAGFLPTRTKIFAALRDRKKRRSELEFKTELTEHINRVWKPPDGSNATKPTKGLMEEFLEDVEVCHLDEDFVSEEEKKKKKKKRRHEQTKKKRVR